MVRNGTAWSGEHLAQMPGVTSYRWDDNVRDTADNMVVARSNVSLSPSQQTAPGWWKQLCPRLTVTFSYGSTMVEYLEMVQYGSVVWTPFMKETWKTAYHTSGNAAYAFVTIPYVKKKLGVRQSSTHPLMMTFTLRRHNRPSYTTRCAKNLNWHLTDLLLSRRLTLHVVCNVTFKLSFRGFTCPHSALVACSHQYWMMP